MNSLRKIRGQNRWRMKIHTMSYWCRDSSKPLKYFNSCEWTLYEDLYRFRTFKGVLKQQIIWERKTTLVKNKHIKILFSWKDFKTRGIRYIRRAKSLSGTSTYIFIFYHVKPGIATCLSWNSAFFCEQFIWTEKHQNPAYIF